MRQLKDVLRLKLELHHSHQCIDQMLGLSKAVVTKYVKLAGAAGLTWRQIQDMDETALHKRLLNTTVRTSDFVTPDYAKLHQELGRKGMTLMLLWQEHTEQHPGQAIHSDSQFCENYPALKGEVCRVVFLIKLFHAGSPEECVVKKQH